MSQDPRSDALVALGPQGREFSELVVSAARNGWTGYLRFNVKFERGKAITAQISTDNVQTIDYPVDVSSDKR